MSTTIMYPGGFKPLTGAHIDIINRYLKHPEVNRIVIFISPTKREEIDSEVAYEIANKILPDPRINIVLDLNSYSPILACYRWIEKKEREKGNYALASSTKGNDYKRVEEFLNNYSPEKFGKNLPNGIKVIELSIDVSPLMYSDGEPISATKVRECVKIGNFEKFRESYPQLKSDQILYIWNKLRNHFFNNQ